MKQKKHKWLAKELELTLFYTKSLQRSPRIQLRSVYLKQDRLGNEPWISITFKIFCIKVESKKLNCKNCKIFTTAIEKNKKKNQKNTEHYLKTQKKIEQNV